MSHPRPGRREALPPVVTAAPARLTPRWAVVLVSAVGPLLCLIGVVMAVLGDGLDRWVGQAYLVMGLAATLASLVAFWPRRARVEDGDLEVTAPVALVAALLTCWAAALGVAVLVVVLIARDGFSAVESPGAALVLVGAAAASLPDLVRLFRGRLHRPRLVVGPDGLGYCGYRTAVHVPWSRVRGARVQAARLLRWDGVPESMRPGDSAPRGYGMVVDLAGRGPDLLVPQAPFRVPVEQLAAAVEQQVGRGS